MKRARTILIRGLLGLSLLALLLVGIEHFRGAFAYHSRLKTLQKAGEKLTLTEWKPPRPAPEQNAAIELLSLTNRLSAAMTNLGELLPAVRMAGPGKQAVTWQVNQWSAGKETNTWERVDAGLASQTALLKEIRTAMAKPGLDAGIDYDKGFDDLKVGPLTVMKKLTQLQCVMVGSRLHAGDLASANEYLIEAVELIRRQKSERLIISQLVRLACGHMAWNATWGALQASGWTEAQLAALQHVWETMDFPSDMMASLEMERAMTIDQFQKYHESAASRDKWFSQVDTMVAFFGDESDKLPTSGFCRQWLHAPLWRACWIDQDALHALDQWQPVIDGGRIAFDQSWAAARERLKLLGTGEDIFSMLFGADNHPKPSLYDRWRYVVSNGPFSINASTILRALKLDTQQQLLVTAIALERHRLKHGQRPDRLEALVPDFLPKLPTDRMDGKPIKYLKRSDGTFVLYSAGENGKDDGGDPAQAVSKKNYTQIWDGLDAVWPAHASAEEAQQALNRAEK